MNGSPFLIGATVAMGAPAGSPFPIVTSDFYQSIDWLCKKGFDSIELHIRTPEQVDGPRMKDYCVKKPIRISSIGTGMAYGMEGLSITSSDPSIREAAIQRLKGQLDLGALLGCPVIIGSMRGRIGSSQTFEQVDAWMVDSMRELADYAEKVDGELVIEAIDRFETNYLKTADDVLGLIDRVGSDRVLVHLDTFHMNLEERDWRTPILHCGKKLGHVHVADNTRYYPGWGLIDFRPILSALSEIEYQRSLTIECFPVPDGYTAAERGLRHLRALIEASSKD